LRLPNGRPAYLPLAPPAPHRELAGPSPRTTTPPPFVGTRSRRNGSLFSRAHVWNRFQSPQAGLESISGSGGVGLDPGLVGRSLPRASFVRHSSRSAKRARPPPPTQLLHAKPDKSSPPAGGRGEG